MGYQRGLCQGSWGHWSQTTYSNIRVSAKKHQELTAWSCESEVQVGEESPGWWRCQDHRMSPEKSYRHGELAQERGYMCFRRQNWVSGACWVSVLLWPIFSLVCLYSSMPLYTGSINLIFDCTVVHSSKTALNLKRNFGLWKLLKMEWMHFALWDGYEPGGDGVGIMAWT